METFAKPTLFRPAEAARYLGISISTFNRWRKEEKVLTPVRVAKTVKFKKSELDAILNGDLQT